MYCIFRYVARKVGCRDFYPVTIEVFIGWCGDVRPQVTSGVGGGYAFFYKRTVGIGDGYFYLLDKEVIADLNTDGIAGLSAVSRYIYVMDVRGMEKIGYGYVIAGFSALCSPVIGYARFGIITAELQIRQDG